MPLLSKNLDHLIEGLRQRMPLQHADVSISYLQRFGQFSRSLCQPGVTLHCGNVQRTIQIKSHQIIFYLWMTKAYVK